MNGKDEDIEIFMAQLEIKNDQPSANARARMGEETQVGMDDENEQQPLRNDALSGITQRSQLKQYLENHRPQI
jgi:hypothetical protein